LLGIGRSLHRRPFSENVLLFHSFHDY
jgi:hypothetical protein